jgi:hypothetical protein
MPMYILNFPLRDLRIKFKKCSAFCSFSIITRGIKYFLQKVPQPRGTFNNAQKPSTICPLPKFVISNYLKQYSTSKHFSGN